MVHSKKQGDVASSVEKRNYPVHPEAYTLYEEIGKGAGAYVYRAVCKPFEEIVAIKILDFEHGDINKYANEAQLMRLVEHPNVVKAHCSFVNEHDLWVVMPFMDGGSCLHILKAAYTEGFKEEAIIATVLHEVLKGLEYLHQIGQIHRDVKAGNILVNSHGEIKLGDFGVSACLFDSCDRLHTRNSIVGTPCWMAPEVVENLHGYDFKADIWSFGITALELAHGHAPFSKYPPVKVFLMTLQHAPPGLDYPRDRKFSKSFKQMIAMCLVKDPLKRPSAKKLLRHPFFKHCKSRESVVHTLLEGLPTLGERLKALKMREADMIAQEWKKEEISQNEYKRGISDWNFNVEDVKAQAALIQDVEETLSEKYQEIGLDTVKQPAEDNSFSVGHYLKDNDADNENVKVLRTKADALSFGEENINVWEWIVRFGLKREFWTKVIISRFGGSVRNPFSDKKHIGAQNVVDCNGTVVPNAVGPSSAKLPGMHLVYFVFSANVDDLDKKPEGRVVQKRGRFKVTSEDVDLEKVHPSPVLQKALGGQVSRTTVFQLAQKGHEISFMGAHFNFLSFSDISSITK
ncbi:hypothetical protein IFM89_005944 [Coptis chinensis]|uniref:Protein kinase domain-containing protein n=1 Tax=Coptis chinensis TaxID=261450 RepID=A0A835IAW3_9MAGN|nr:hypothetical protein IFM89_005944 [Coptis chinensis]